MNYPIGFSTGCLYKEDLTLRERIAIIKNLGCEAVELGMVKMHSFRSGELQQLTREDLAGFSHVSLHTPKFAYQDNAETREILSEIKRINELCTLDCVVVHPDTVLDFSVFRNSGLNIAFENMDNRKDSHQSADDFSFLEEADEFGFVLDVNHIFSNDSSMELAKEFHKLKNKTWEVHLSGYKGYHEPIHETRQTEIIDAVRPYNVPVIIESVLTLKNIKDELDYIKERLAQIREKSK